MRPNHSRNSDGGAESQKLHKILAQSGLGSRRGMEQLIEEGKVTVNGQPATVATRVGPEDHVQIEGKRVNLRFTVNNPRVLLYHKPEGEIVSRDDPEGRASVFEKLPGVHGGRWIAIGRLDVNTSGLLIFTNHGELANSLMHPRFELEREYAVRILGRLTAEQIERLEAGIELEDGLANVHSVEDRGGDGANHWYHIVINEGRNREVRRLFEALGLTVSRLIRVRFGDIELPPYLKRGQKKELAADQVREMMQWAGVSGGKSMRSGERGERGQRGSREGGNRMRGNRDGASQEQGAPRGRGGRNQGPRRQRGEHTQGGPAPIGPMDMGADGNQDMRQPSREQPPRGQQRQRGADARRGRGPQGGGRGQGQGGRGQEGNRGQGNRGQGGRGQEGNRNQGGRGALPGAEILNFPMGPLELPAGGQQRRGGNGPRGRGQGGAGMGQGRGRGGPRQPFRGPMDTPRFTADSPTLGQRRYRGEIDDDIGNRAPPASASTANDIEIDDQIGNRIDPLPNGKATANPRNAAGRPRRRRRKPVAT